MSASVPRGETALFTCAANGDVYWTINGEYDDAPASKERGVNVAYHVTGFLLANSTLTIPATMENDNVSIQCAFPSATKLVLSPVVFLTVLGKLCIVDK